MFGPLEIQRPLAVTIRAAKDGLAYNERCVPIGL